MARDLSSALLIAIVLSYTPTERNMRCDESADSESHGIFIRTCELLQSINPVRLLNLTDPRLRLLRYP